MPEAVQTFLSARVNCGMVVTELWLVSPCALSWCVLRTEIICGAVWAEATAADPTNKQIKSAA